MTDKGAVIAFEYQFSARKWVAYDDAINKLLRKGFNEKKTEIASRIGDWDVRFDLGQMRQINVASGFSRPIRCSVKMNPDESAMVWERNIARRWQSFSPLSTQQLEQAYADKDIQQNPLVLSLQLGEQEKEYELDLENWSLRHTLNGAEERVPIRRTESHAEAADSMQPVPATGSPAVLRNRAATKDAGNKGLKKATKEPKKKMPEKGDETKKKQRKRKAATPVSDSESENEEEEASNSKVDKNKAKKKTTKKQRKNATSPSLSESENEEKAGEHVEDEDESSSNLKAKATKQPKSQSKGGRKRVMMDDEEMNSDDEKLAAVDEEEEESSSKSNSKVDDTKSKKSNASIKRRKRIAISDESEGEAKEDCAKNGDAAVKANKGTGKMILEDQSPSAEMDSECTGLAGSAAVVYVDGSLEYSTMLNQTNVQFNNNKFYLLQLLHYKKGTQQNYAVWLRWGRVGVKGQMKLTEFGDNLEKARALFHEKFYDKTRNQFSADGVAAFEKVAGKYDLIRMDHEKAVTNEPSGQNGGKKAEKEGKNKEMEESKLDERIQALMRLICDFDAMEREAKRLDYDANKVPLGKITKAQIKAGNEALSRIEACIKEGKFGNDYTEALNAYYTRIPHAFGMRVPPAIKTVDALQHEISLLEFLDGVEMTVSHARRNHVDDNHDRLKWALAPVETGDERFQIITEYFKNTHGPTHGSAKLAIKNVFELEEKNTTHVFNEQLGNRKLLWHGSRITNFFGILSQGLRIAPPEAPTTGWMFGKGVYFADMASKSANYALSGHDKRKALMLLSEVALGSPQSLYDADYEMCTKKLATIDKHSVLGVGRWMPDSGASKTIFDGQVEVPCGQPVETTSNKSSGTRTVSPSLLYNEYIVYDVGQIRERFLVEFDFDHGFEL